MKRTAICLSLALGLALVGGRSASATDYWDLSTGNDNGFGSPNELVHGTSQQHDLQANAGFADEDWYDLNSDARSSYEAVIDSTGGDLNLTSTDFQRLNFGGTVLQSSEFANINGFGHSVALRWQNTGVGDINYLRVQSASCGITCGAEDQYHIRFYETTVSVPRFNNASGQVTVLIIQNATEWVRPIAGTVYFFNAVGTVVGSTTFILGGDAARVLNTGTVPGVAGVSGTIKVAHDGGYGGLAIKSVALEPATGFSFDSPGTYKPQ